MARRQYLSVSPYVRALCTVVLEEGSKIKKGFCYTSCMFPGPPFSSNAERPHSVASPDSQKKSNLAKYWAATGPKGVSHPY